MAGQSPWALPEIPGEYVPGKETTMGEPNDALTAGSAGGSGATAPAASGGAEATAEPQKQMGPTESEGAAPTASGTPELARTATGTEGQDEDLMGIERLTNLFGKLGLVGDLDPAKAAMREEIIRINSGRLKAQQQLAAMEARTKQMEAAARPVQQQSEARTKADELEQKLEEANYDMAQVREKRLRDGDARFAEQAEFELWAIAHGYSLSNDVDVKIARAERRSEEREMRYQAILQQKEQETAETEMVKDFGTWAGKTPAIKDDPVMQEFVKEYVMGTYYTAPDMEFEAFCADRLGEVQKLVTHLTEKIRKSLLAEGQKRVSGVKPPPSPSRQSAGENEKPLTVEEILERAATRALQ